MQKNELLEKLITLKRYPLKDCFEIYFEKQFLIPYSSIDDVIQQYPDYGGTAIYMILQSDRLELTGISWNTDPPTIEYKNSATNQSFSIKNLWFFPYPVRKDALHMEIVSNTQLEVGGTGMPPVKYHIYDLVTQSNRNMQTIQSFQLLYIGSSKNIYSRLVKHETILKIYRHTATVHPEQELFVWILKPKYKFISHLPQKSLLSPQELLCVSEAMLIHYFKPAYNDQYVRKLPNQNHAAYRKLQNTGMQYIQLNLNLFMQTYQNLLSISSGSENTNQAKHIQIYGAVKDLARNPKSSILSADVLPEEFYTLFMDENNDSKLKKP